MRETETSHGTDTMCWGHRTIARLLPALRPHFASAFVQTAEAIGATDAPRSQRSTSASTPVANKMVDYCINLEPEWTLAGAIHRACAVPVDFAPAGINTINQTLCEAVQLRPMALSVETKTDRTGVADADVKLAVWMAAWRARMMPLVEQRRDKAQCITQLGLTAIGDTWKLYFLVDQGPGDAMGPRLQLLEFPRAIGTTRTVLGLYQLLAVLRHLCAWADQHLRRWLEEILL